LDDNEEREDENDDEGTEDKEESDNDKAGVGDRGCPCTAVCLGILLGDR